MTFRGGDGRHGGGFEVGACPEGLPWGTAEARGFEASQ
jgi:hypothetical protein